jgi:glycosyltransferase involved in cell wall biosynthesis
MPHDTRSRILLAARGLDPVGTGRQIELLAAGLRTAGWDVHVAATSGGGGVPDRLAARGFAVHRLGMRPVTDAAAGVRLVRLARRLRPAVLLACGRSQVPLAAAVKLAAPDVLVAVQLAVRPRKRSWPALRGVDLAVATTPAVAAACGRLGLDASRIETIPPGITADPGGGVDRGRIAARLGLDPGKVWTLAVAPLEADARLERLVWAIDQLGVVRKDLEHVLVGAGPLLGRVRRRSRVQELAERLVVVPHCDLLPDLLGEVRIVWQSGDVAHGGAILDGMARGVPAVAVASDAARQLVVDQETGRVVPAVPESEFPRRTFGILEDEPLATRYAEAARRRAELEFPVARMVEAHVAAFARLA